MSVNDTWNEGFIKLGNKYVDLYMSGKFELEQLAAIPSHRETLNEVYNVLVRQNKLLPIESLEPKEKKELWAACKGYVENLPTAERMKFCKCYWALSCLAQKRVV